MSRILFWTVVLFFTVTASLPGQTSKISVEKIAYKGWKNNLRLSNGKVELIVTLDVGPRIISYRPAGGKNVLKEYTNQMGKSGEAKWQIRGGHRLWTAPEDLTRTYFPDNHPVQYKKIGAGKFRFSPAPETKYGIQKELIVALAPQSSKVSVTHRITNIGKKRETLAIWALTVLAPGGKEIIPLPKKRPHPGPPEKAKSPKDYAPDLKMVFWSYFNFNDRRCHLGTKYITLDQDSKAKRPIKFGLLHLLDWIAYLNNNVLFVKQIPYQNGKTYPDGGCNFETFTNADMLEMESLGPLVTLAPGERTEMTETWELFSGVQSVRNEADIDRYVLPKVRR